MGKAVRSTMAMLATIFAVSAMAPHAAGGESWPPPGVSFSGDPAVPDISGLWLGSETGIPGVEFAPNRGPADGSPPTFWAPWPPGLLWQDGFPRKIASPRSRCTAECSIPRTGRNSWR